MLLPKSTNYIAVTPTAKQMAFLWLDCIEAFYGGAAGGGKSIALLMAALQYVDAPNYNAILIRDSFKNLSMPDSVMDVAYSWLRPTDALWNEDKKRWTFPSGATLSFGYLDGPRDHFNYQSAQFQFVGIDESVNIRENQALYMFSRLRKLKNNPIPIRFRCASNPPAPEQVSRGSWVKSRYVDPRTKEKKAIYIPAQMQDNPYLDGEEYRKSMMNLDPVTRKQLEEGDWEIQARGRMFDRSWFEIVDVAPVNAKKVRYWDLAATEPIKRDHQPAYTCGAKVSKTEEGIYYIENIARLRKEPLQVQRTVKNMAEIDSIGTYVWMEQEPGSSGKNTIDYYRRQVLSGFVFKADKVSGSKFERAAPFSSQCEAGNVKLVMGNWIQAFFEEIELFPDGQFKDQIDACSGAFGALNFNRSARTKII